MNQKNQKKVVVTGGAGFIGSNLVRTLLKKGYEVHVVDNYAGGRFPQRISEDAIYHEGDINDSNLLREVFKDTDFVFHTAALPSVPYSLEYPHETNEVNAKGTLSVLKAAKEGGVKKVIYSASSAAYGDQTSMPLVETMEARPQSPYALQKYIGELYSTLFATVYGLRTVSLRYFNVYGPHADPNGPYALVIARFIQQRANGEPMTIAGDGTNTRDYTHVSDVVRANIFAAENDSVGNGEVINIGGGKNISVNEVAAAVGGPTITVEPRLEPKHSLADTSMAKELLGWEPSVSFEEAIAELKREAGIA